MTSENSLICARFRLEMKAVRRPADAFLLLRVSCVAALVPVAMRLPLPKTTALIRPRSPRAARRGAPPEYAGRVVAAVEAARIAGYPVIRQGCLTRAVTLYWFLARAGMPVELRFGIARDASPDIAADGHAWLALDGAPFLEKVDPEPKFTVTYRIPA